jgi:TonB family protein
MKRNIIFVLMIVSVHVILSTQGYDFKVSAANRYASLQEPAGEDTTVYKMPAFSAELPDAVAYFRQNNKFKDWDKNDKKIVFIQGVVEKNGTITNVMVKRSSGVTKLDEESLRLIKSVKYSPGKDANGQDVRSIISIVVPFPAS